MSGKRSSNMLDVFFTVDVEVWCDGWDGLDRKFPDSFRRYVYGPTPKGDYALPFKLQLLQDHGLKGVFFVEPLFATRFGMDPLREIIELIAPGDQEIQLHLHSEWVDEAPAPLFPENRTKRQFMRDFSREEQVVLIRAGLQLLLEGGAGRANAFRAGSFGFNRDTLFALASNEIPFDSSYNAAMTGSSSGVAPGRVLVEPLFDAGVYEYPLTVFDDGTQKLRPVQLTACSWREMEQLLWQALESGRRSFVMLSHNFELMTPAKTRPDPIVVKRFRQLCAFLDRNRDCFRTTGFRELTGESVSVQPPPLISSRWNTAGRYLEQLARRRYE
jgi:hypothetical protein